MRPQFLEKVWILTRKHEFRSKNQLGRIQHTLLPTEKKFIENERKISIFDMFFGRQELGMDFKYGFSVNRRFKKNMESLS